MNFLLVAPIIVPLASAALGFVVRQPRAHAAVSIAGAVVLLVCALLLTGRILEGGVVATQLGSWPAPFGITIVADLLSALMVLVAAVIGLAVFVYSTASVDSLRKAHGFYPLLHVLLMGVTLSFVLSLAEE